MELVKAFEKLGYTQEEMEEIINKFNAAVNVHTVSLETSQKSMKTYINK